MLEIPRKIWVEMCEGEDDVCDVIVETDDGAIYTAMFVTLPYLHRQMQLNFDMIKQFSDVAPVPYATLETPHVIADNLNRDTIEDVIDNLLALEVFESYFTKVYDPLEAEPSTGNGNRATQEVAAVVLSDVLVVEG